MFEVSTTSSKLQHKPLVAYFDKSSTVLSIGPCGRLPHITWSASLTSAIVFGFVLSLEQASNIAPHTQ